jgi:hypothetical protein
MTVRIQSVAPLPTLYANDFLAAEPPHERFERIADTTYVRITLTADRHAYGIVVNSNPFTRELMIEWWNPIFRRAQTDTFCLADVHPLGELRDAVTYVDSAGEVRRGFVVCCDGDVVELEDWRSGGPVPLRARVPIADVWPFTRLVTA